MSNEVFNEFVSVSNFSKDSFLKVRGGGGEGVWVGREIRKVRKLDDFAHL